MFVSRIIKKTSQPISTKFSGKMVNGPRKKPIDFDGNVDRVTSELGLGLGEGYGNGQWDGAITATLDTFHSLDVCLTSAASAEAYAPYSVPFYWAMPVSEMTYTVSSGTLNSTMPYHLLGNALPNRHRSVSVKYALRYPSIGNKHALAFRHVHTTERAGN